MKILNFGSCNIDFVYSMNHIVTIGETATAYSLELFPGGKGLNQSIAAARAGAEVFHAGCIGEDGDKFLKAADRLKRNIMRDYWREDRGAFVDCFTSGKENVTRHAHIFALMYDFVSEKRARRIMRSVLENDEVTAITTPYFEFFELCALCRMGRLKHMQKKIESYWGGMVKLGATSIWEEYIPEQEGAEHYSSYGMRYGRSLCHAWGGGPIYLLGRYCLGVYPTSVGYATYAVEPRLGVYKSINGRVPLPDGGEVWVRADAKTCTVVSNRKGGTLIFGGREYKLPVGEFCVEI